MNRQATINFGEVESIAVVSDDNVCIVKHIVERPDERTIVVRVFVEDITVIGKSKRFNFTITIPKDGET